MSDFGWMALLMRAAQNTGESKRHVLPEMMRCRLGSRMEDGGSGHAPLSVQSLLMEEFV